MIDLQFGTGDVACHLVLELYDRGNMVLTDHKYLILNILRPRVAQETKFLARETYPVDQCRPTAAAGSEVFTADSVKADIINQSALGKPIKKVLVSHVDQGPAFLDHLLAEAGTRIMVYKGPAYKGQYSSLFNELCHCHYIEKSSTPNPM